MKTKILLILLGLAFSTAAAFGQTGESAFFLEAAPTYTFFRGNPMIVHFNRPVFSFAGGAGLECNLSEIFSLKTVLLFERKSMGSQSIVIDNTGAELGWLKVRGNADYIVVPVMLKVTIGSKARFFVNAGPYIGYLIQLRSISQPIADFPRRSTDITHSFKRIDFGASAGLGVSLPLDEKVRLSLEIRNNLGLYNISKLPVVNDGSILTTSINLMTGVAFSLGK